MEVGATAQMSLAISSMNVAPQISQQVPQQQVTEYTHSANNWPTESGEVNLADVSDEVRTEALLGASKAKMVNAVNDVAGQLFDIMV